MGLSSAVRQSVRLRAGYLCEYCHSSEEVSAARFEIDHIHPRSLGGSDDLDNLALACQRCNSHRYNFTVGVDPETDAVQPLFNSRRQSWPEHFIWSVDGLKILGTTAIGRATVERLDVNDERHNDGAIVQARALWVQVGWHPPSGDPRQSNSL